MNQFQRNVIIYFLVCFGAAVALSAQTLSVDKTILTFSSQVGGTAQSQTVNVNVSGNTSGNPVLFQAASLTPWVTVNPGVGTAPSAVTVRVDPTGFAASATPYQGTIIFTGPANSVLVQVSLTVSNVAVSPASLQFAYQIGGSPPAAQTLTLSGQNVAFLATAGTASGGNWLQVSPTNGNVPGTLSVSLTPVVLAGLAAGPYTGSITLTGGVGAPITVPVSLQISASPPVSVSPSSVTLYFQNGGTNNSPSQTVTLSTSSGVQPVSFSFLNSVDNNPSGRIWFTESPSSGGSIPANGSTTVTFSYDTTANLPPGTYTGKASLLTPGGSPTQQDIPVKLVVSSLPLLNPSTSALSFTYQLGTANPPAQNITVNSTGGATPLTLTATTSSGGSWLSVPANATAGTAFAVTVNAAGLATGNYTGTVNVTAPAAANSPLQITVNLKVANDALIVATANGCSTANLTCTLLFPVQIGQSLVPSSQIITVTTSTGDALSYTATASSSECGGNWLAVSGGIAGTTPGTFSAAVNATGISVGKCNGSIIINATNPSTQAAAPNSPLTISVAMYVSDNALLIAIPNAITFNAQVNGQSPPQQNITLASTSSTDQLNYTVTLNTVTGSNWLFVNSVGGVTSPIGSTLAVSALPGILSPGTYTGTVTIAATGPGGAAVADSPISIPVIFNVNAGTIAADKTSLTFMQLAGGSAPPAQTVNVTGTPGPIAFTVSTTTETGGSWLAATTSATATPGAVQVSANAGTLAAGTYNGSVIIRASTPPGANGSPITIPVTLTVSAPQSLSASPDTLTFTYIIGGATPDKQTVALSSTGANAPFTVTVPSTASWLSVTPTSGTTPASLTFAVNPQGLTIGQQAKVTVSSAAALNPVTITVNLALFTPTPPAFTSIANAASYAPGAVAPGENVTIFGTNIGPDPLAGPQLTPSGMLATTVSDTQVTFDNVPAPIIYVSSQQTSVMVPYEVTGRPTTQVRVTYKGVTSDPVTYNVTNTVPGIYTQNSQGNGPGSILNQDLSVNGPTNPAAKNSVVAVYMTGEGVTQPPSTTGAVAGTSGNPLNKTPLAVTATVGGLPATVEYYSEAPGIVYGVMQVNVRIPANIASGAQTIVITVGPNSTQPNVTVSVQ